MNRVKTGLRRGASYQKATSHGARALQILGQFLMMDIAIKELCLAYTSLLVFLLFFFCVLDINECETRNFTCTPQQTCFNIPGEYKCLDPVRCEDPYIQINEK